MITEQDVALFLREFNDKMGVWDVLFRDDRGKNAQTLIDLELRPNRTQENLRIIRN